MCGQRQTSTTPVSLGEAFKAISKPFKVHFSAVDRLFTSGKCNENVSILHSSVNLSELKPRSNHAVIKEMQKEKAEGKKKNSSYYKVLGCRPRWKITTQSISAQTPQTVSQSGGREMIQACEASLQLSSRFRVRSENTCPADNTWLNWVMQ